MRRDTSWRMLLAAFFLLLLAVSQVQAEINPATVQKLLAADGTVDDRFGYSISVSDDTAVIGVPYDDNHGLFFGSAYVFVRSSNGMWIQQAKLTAVDCNSSDYFGESVSVSGDTALIGANNNNHTGSVYVFVRSGTTWTQQAKLTAQDIALSRPLA